MIQLDIILSWGHIGSLWGKGTGKDTIIVYVRPQRYTREFLDQSDTFTLSVLSPKYKKEYGYFGRISGRDEDKIKNSSLAPIQENNTLYFKESKLVFVCKKIFVSKMNEEDFIDKVLIKDNNPNKDFHYIYIGEILKVYEDLELK